MLRRKGGVEKRRDKAIVEAVGILKLCKGLLLFAAAIGAFRLWGSDIEDTLTSLVKYFHVDPGNHYFRTFLGHALGLSSKLPLLTIGFFAYGAVFLVEGMGLVMRKHWAEYFTTIVTGSFLPIEIYEFFHHESAVKAIVILLNAAIVIYFIRRLKREHDERALMSAPARASQTR
jgi:uncharacterized membrane protein (DUF2068 family)